MFNKVTYKLPSLSVQKRHSDDAIVLHIQELWEIHNLRN